MAGRKEVLALMVGGLIAFQLVAATKAAHFSLKTNQGSLDESQKEEERVLLGEHVDGMARAAGDRFLGLGRDQDGQNGQTASNQLWTLNNEQQTQAGAQLSGERPAYLMDNDGYLSASDVDIGSYRALVDEFKHWSPLANPSRQSRAFKPRLMSTARGFGKRANWQEVRNRRPPSYVDLAMSPMDTKLLESRMANLLY